MSISFELGLRQRNVPPTQDFEYPLIKPELPTDAEASPPLAQAPSPDLRARDQAQAEAVLAARELGIREGRAQAEADLRRVFEPELEQQKDSLAAAVSDFGAERARYFRQVESEAVRLALAVARKVLHREAQMDPLLLAGVVRVALDQVHHGSRVVLHVAEASVAAWRQHFENQKWDALDVEVVGEPGLDSRSCRLEAEAGSADVSLDEQLTEIERGFFDLLAQRAEVNP